MTDATISTSKPAGKAGRATDKAAPPAASGAGAAAASEAPRPAVMIPLGTLEHREQRNNDWRAVVPAGTTAEDINFKPGACALISSRLMLGDTLTLITQDGKTLIRAVCVMGDQGGSAMCAVTDEFDLQQTAPLGDELPAGYSVRRTSVADEERGYQLGMWIGQRDSDGHPMTEALPTQGDAKSALQRHAAFRDGAWRKQAQH